MAHVRSRFDVRRSSVAIAALLVSALTAGTAAAQQTQTQTQPFEPQVGQAGKDVVWVPTAEALVEKMLDLAKITAQDFVMDLGSGDGRNVIGAAKRGARAIGVEFNSQMVELSRDGTGCRLGFHQLVLGTRGARIDKHSDRPGALHQLVQQP